MRLRGRRRRPGLRTSDVLRVGTTGVRQRPVRAILSALGIAIGIAAMVATVGVSSSSQAQLQAEFQALGTDLLTLRPSSAVDADAQLPADAADRVARIPGVDGTGSVSPVPDAHVFRNEFSDPRSTQGLSVLAAGPGLDDVLGLRHVAGHGHDAASAQLPTVVLGDAAARRLGVSTVGTIVWLGGQPVTVIGILQPVPLAPELDVAAIVGESFARDGLRAELTPSTVYERSDPADVAGIQQLLGRTVDPENPGNVEVGRPSDALAAQYLTDRTLTGLLLGLGSVSLLVGGVGVANTMVVAVLERRRETGLRRALGATRGDVRRQFVVEAVVVAGSGGVAGAVLGTAATLGFALATDTVFALPWLILPAAVAGTVVIGVLAGSWPASRAARQPPTAALTG